MIWLKKYRDIANGWKNYIFPNKEAEELAEKRAKICAGCPLNVNNDCSSKKQGPVAKSFLYEVKNEYRVEGEIKNGCGCPISTKTRSLQTQCPLNYWN
jgi:hypothetical protein